MKFSFLAIFMLFSLLCGCTAVKFVAKPFSPTDRVDSSDQSITSERDRIRLTARVQNTAVGGYDVETAIASFYVVLKNSSEKSMPVSLENFVLIDGSGQQLKPLEPEAVNLLLSADTSPLFLPYPFVGYYSSIDLEQHRTASEMAGERPFMTDGLSAIEVLSPLPVAPVAAGGEIAGMLYFQLELIEQASFELRANLDGNRHYRFPFSLAK